MYAKYIVLCCLLGLSALLPAQAADQNRINIRIFPSQVLSITTAQDSQNNTHIPSSNPEHRRKELTASNLYGYQIKLINEKQSPIIQPTVIKDECSVGSELVYTKISSSIDQKISTSQLSTIQKEKLNKCLISSKDRMLVYVIITQ